MAIYKITVAHSIQCHGQVEIEASNDKQALLLARKHLAEWVDDGKGPFAAAEMSPAWDLSDDFRVVGVDRDDGRVVSDGIDPSGC